MARSRNSIATTRDQGLYFAVCADCSGVVPVESVLNVRRQADVVSLRVGEASKDVDESLGVCVHTIQDENRCNGPPSLEELIRVSPPAMPQRRGDKAGVIRQGKHFGRVSRLSMVRLRSLDVFQEASYGETAFAMRELVYLAVAREASEGWWTRTQRIRTVAHVPFQVAFLATPPQPIYMSIARKALQLHELGFSNSAIARRLGVTDKTVAKAIRLIRGITLTR